MLKRFISTIVVVSSAAMMPSHIVAQECSVNDVRSYELGLEANVTRATTRNEKYSADLSIQRSLPKWCHRLSVNLRPSYEEKRPAGKPASYVRVHTAELNYLHFLGRNRLFLSPGARLIHSTNLGVKLQQTYSIPVGALTKKGWSIAAGPAYVLQEFIPDTVKTRQYFAGLAVIGKQFKWRPSGMQADITLSPSISVTEPLEDSGGRVATTAVALNVPVYKYVSLTMEVLDEYISNPPVNFDPHYTNVALRVTLSF